MSGDTVSGGISVLDTEEKAWFSRLVIIPGKSCFDLKCVVHSVYREKKKKTLSEGELAGLL